MATAYPDAGTKVRQAAVQCILAHQPSAHKDSSAEEQTARAHYKWLTWLQRTAPDWRLLQKALASIKKRYPARQPSEYPYHLISDSPLNLLGLLTRSPWSVKQLLSKPADKCIDGLRNFKDDYLNGLIHIVAS